MPVSCQVVRFQKSTGANGTTQDVALNFTPKAIIVFSAGGTAEDTAEAEYQVCLGFSDGTNHVAIASGSDDGSAAADTGRIIRNDSVFVRLSTTVPSTTTLCSGSCIFQTNNVRFTWTVNDAVATYITLVAYGGDDITNVKVGTHEVVRTTTGTQDYTGLGFNPSTGNAALFLISNSLVTASVNTNATIGFTNFGCAVSTTKRWCISNLGENAADPSDTWRITFNDHCLHYFNSTGATDATADFNGWVTDGFQLDWDNAPPGATVLMGYLVINGGTWDAGVLTSPTTATNNVDYTVSVSSHTLRGLMIAGCASTANATIDTHAIVTLGATDGTNQSVISSIDEDAQATMDSYRINNATNIVKQLTVNGAAENIATFDSFGTDSFRLDHTTQVAFSQIYGWVVVADAEAGAVVEEEISPSKSFGTLGYNSDIIGSQAIFGGG